MEDVGRSWYVKITTGMVGGSAELGTHHLATGVQVWDRANIEVSLPMTERQVLEELYYALSVFMERRA